MSDGIAPAPADRPGALPTTPSVAGALVNLRDIGGLRTDDGQRVRHGLVFRSAALPALGASEATHLASLGLRTIYDLRTPADRRRNPDAPSVIEGRRVVVADVLAGTPEHDPSRMGMMLEDPAVAAAALGEGRAERFFLDRYREFVELEPARAAFGSVLSDMAAPGSLPGLVHCTTGKDRTGWLVAVLLLLVGVRAEDVLADYLASNDGLRAFMQPMLEQYAARGGEPRLLLPLMEARPAYLEAALDAVRRRYGDIAGYAERGLNLGPTVRDRLRRHLLLESA